MKVIGYVLRLRFLHLFSIILRSPSAPSSTASLTSHGATMTTHEFFGCTLVTFSATPMHQSKASFVIVPSLVKSTRQMRRILPSLVFRRFATATTKDAQDSAMNWASLLCKNLNQSSRQRLTIADPTSFIWRWCTARA